MAVLRLRQSYMTVNFHLCAISGNKIFSPANEELIFPRFHLKPLIVSFILWCTANFRCSFTISCSRCPSSFKFRCVSTTSVNNSCCSLQKKALSSQDFNLEAATYQQENCTNLCICRSMSHERCRWHQSYRNLAFTSRKIHIWKEIERFSLLAKPQKFAHLFLKFSFLSKLLYLRIFLERRGKTFAVF